MLVSLDVWDMLAGRKEMVVRQRMARRSVVLRRSKTVFEGRVKTGDLRAIGFVNCFGSVREPKGGIWRFGNSREDGLKPPGQTSRRRG
jgi:hypothetical protein